MKYHFLLLSGALCAVVGSAQAQTAAPQPDTQNQPSVTLRAPRLDTPPIYIGFSLQPVEGKPGVFRLDAKRVDAKQLLTTLVQEAKGTASFLQGPVQDPKSAMVTIYYTFPSISLTLVSPLEGTIEQLIEKFADASNVNVTHENNRWTFFRTALRLNVPTVVSPRPNNSKPEFSPGFNANRNPGKIPEDAKPFDFNGDLYYHMPVN